MKTILIKTLVTVIGLLVVMIGMPMALYYYQPNPNFIGFIGLLLFTILIFMFYKDHKNQFDKQKIEAEKEKMISKLKQEVDEYEKLKGKLLKLPKEIREKYEI